jgi:uncharacterized repeat protein (TIGR01451 family)
MERIANNQKKQVKVPHQGSLAFLLLYLTFGFLSSAFAQHTPVQQYYLPYKEADIWSSVQKIYPRPTCADLGAFNPTLPIRSYNVITVKTAGTIIIYDHHEDGFELNPGTPTSFTTEIWGDGNISNGMPPGYTTDMFVNGSTIILSSEVTPSDPDLTYDFDGGDSLSATIPIAISRTGWAAGSGTLLSDAWELYPTYTWGTAFNIPVGENLSSNQAFEYSALSIMASVDNTTVMVDADANGVFEVNTTINQGQSVFVNGGIQSSAQVVTSAPVQVQMFTGDICAAFESRWFTIPPSIYFSSSYILPVSTRSSDRTEAWLHNVNPSAITIDWITNPGGAQASFTIPANGTIVRAIPNGSGAAFTERDGNNFTGVATVDADVTGGDGNSSANDWGFTLVPKRDLLQQVLVGWGSGQDPLLPPEENGSPVWMTADYPVGSSSTGAIDVCIDYKGDGAGLLTDIYGNHYDQQINVTPLARHILFDPAPNDPLPVPYGTDGDQTAMFVYVCDNSDGIISLAWGQNPSSASDGAPAIDLGTSLVPFQRYFSRKEVVHLVDQDNDGDVELGDTLMYRIRVIAQGTLPVPPGVVTVSDTLPSRVTYVAGSTEKTDGATTSAIPDDMSGTPFPIDGAGYLLPDGVPAGGAVTISFRVIVGDASNNSSCQVRNTATADGPDGTFTSTAISTYVPHPSISLKKLTNDIDVAASPGPSVLIGSSVTWKYQITNTGDAELVHVVLNDDQQGGITIPGAGSISGDTDNDGILDVSETWEVTSSANALAGQYTNVATVSAQTGCGESVQSSDTSYYFGTNAAIAINKVTNGSDGPFIPTGAPVTWTYSVSNVGVATVMNVTVVDSVEGNATYISGDTNNDSRLQLSETWIFRITGTAGIGSYSNSATASAQDEVVGTTVRAMDDSSYFGVNAAIVISKLTNGSDGSLIQAGSPVIWTYTVANAGNIPLTSISVIDNLEGTATYVSGDTNNDGILQTTEVWSYSINGTAFTGLYQNIGTVTSIEPLTNQMPNASDPSSYTGTDGSIRIVKSTNNVNSSSAPGIRVAEGTPVTWTYEVTNGATSNLSNVVVTDDQEGTASYISGDTNNNSLLEPSETWLFQLTGAAQAGQYSNIGTVTARTPLNQTISAMDPDFYFGNKPAIDIIKKTNGVDSNTSPGIAIDAGLAVTWTYEVRNTGNVPLQNVLVTDSIEGTAAYQSGDDGDSLLETGEIWIYRILGTALGSAYTNIGSVIAQDELGTTVGDSHTNFYDGKVSSIHIEKFTNDSEASVAPGIFIAPGSAVTWTYVVSNSGTQHLNMVNVTDSDSGLTVTYVSGDSNNNGILETSEIWTYRATGVAQSGQYSNIGTVRAKNPGGETVEDNDPGFYFGGNGQLEIRKFTNGLAVPTPPGNPLRVGTSVVWTYQVTNPGTVPVEGVVVTDNPEGIATFISGDSNTNLFLDPGETWNYQIGGAVLEGQYSNSATVTGEDLAGRQLNDSDISHYFGYQSSLTIEKSTNGIDADIAPGPQILRNSAITWQYVVRNTGNVALRSVTVTDDREGSPTFISGDTDDDDELDTDETWIYEQTGIATLGAYANIGTARAQDTFGNSVSDTDPSHYIGKTELTPEKCNVTDFDNDGIPDVDDEDMDGDGILNILEGEDDIDGDGLPNMRDSDSDGDGLYDITEGQAVSPPLAVSNVDIDQNGVDDQFDAGQGGVPSGAVDTDADGIPDYKDTDSDSDGLSDTLESLGPDQQFPPPLNKDDDCNGIDDAYDPPLGGVLLKAEDRDGNGVPDFREAMGQCTDVSLTADQLSIDGSALRLKSMAVSAAEARIRLSKLKLCEPFEASELDFIKQRSNELYQELWTSTWSVPSRHYPCQAEAPKSCESFSTATIKEKNSDTSNSLYQLIARLGRPCGTNAHLRRMRRKSRTIRRSMLDEIEGLPNPVLLCQ